MSLESKLKEDIAKTDSKILSTLKEIETLSVVFAESMFSAECQGRRVSVEHWAYAQALADKISDLRSAILALKHK